MPQIRDDSDKSSDAKSEEIATLRRYVAAVAGDARTRAQLFLSFYYKLISGKPGLAKYLSVAAGMIVVFEGVNYRIVE